MRWKYRTIVLILCTFALFVTVFGRLALSPVVPDIATEFDTSNTRIGVALTGMWLAYALTQFPSGLLADRFGDRLLILISVGGTGLTALIIVAAPNFGIFVLGTVLLGASPASTIVLGPHSSQESTIELGPLSEFTIPVHHLLDCWPLSSFRGSPSDLDGDPQSRLVHSLRFRSPR